MELTYGTVYCFKCRDYIYDFSLDEVSRSVEQQVAHTRFLTSRQPVAYVAWEPTRDEIQLLKQNPKRKKVESGSTIGKPVHIPISGVQVRPGYVFRSTLTPISVSTNGYVLHSNIRVYQWVCASLQYQGLPMAMCFYTDSNIRVYPYSMLTPMSGSTSNIRVYFQYHGQWVCGFLSEQDLRAST